MNFKDFMKTCNLRNDTRNESQLQKYYNYPTYPRDSIIYSDERLVNIDNRSQGGTHWTCFILYITNLLFLTRLVASQLNFY